VLRRGRRARAQAATAYTKEQREGLLAAREALFRRMHQILEQRERLVATLQAGFPSTDTEHANAPLYVAVRSPMRNPTVTLSQQTAHVVPPGKKQR
jgi:hypothetical protein